MRHTVVTMSRGDADKIAEWLRYHARLGFEDFQIVLDGDIDGTEDLLRTLDVPARVTVHPRAEVGEYHDGMAPDERRMRVQQWRTEHAAALESGAMRGIDAISWRQQLHLAEVFAPYAAGARGRGWLTLIDVDEFIVLTEHGSIGALTADAEAPRLRFVNFNVDTTGHDPRRPVLEQHTMRWSIDDILAHPDRRWARRVKSIVRYRCARVNSSVHKINKGRHALLDPAVARLHHFKMPVNELDIPYTVDDPVPLPG